jgi:hypothetical protein
MPLAIQKPLVRPWQASCKANCSRRARLITFALIDLLTRDMMAGEKFHVDLYMLSGFTSGAASGRECALQRHADANILARSNGLAMLDKMCKALAGR